MKPGLSLRVTQQLALTPQLQQSIRLLQLSTLELTQEIEQMLVDNPFLEPSEDEEQPEPAEMSPLDLADAAFSVASSAGATGVDGEWDDEIGAEPPSWSDDWGGDAEATLTPDDRDWGSDAPARAHANGSDDDETDAGAWTHAQEGLREHLQRQALTLRLDAAERLALTLLIESLDDDGYLSDALPDLIPTLRAALPGLDGPAGEGDDTADPALALLQRALCWLHNLEPAGVGARGLAECLDLQLRARAADRPCPVTALARRIVAQPLDLLARRDWRRLGVLCQATETELRAAAALVTRLEPKPGRRFVDVQRQLVVPDVLVLPAGRAGQRQWQVRLNDAVLPRLRLVERYAQALRGNRGNGTRHAAMQTHLQEARWFLKNIQQRFDTILRVSRAIVERQKGFLAHGELAMRPLVLREIADELGLHESTVSRVTSGKYMATPQGTFELKYFFGSGLDTDTGGAASSTAVRALIKQFVAAEDAQRPLSDGQISDLLRQQGIACARRTVAKYREALKIAPTTLRKSL